MEKGELMNRLNRIIVRGYKSLKDIDLAIGDRSILIGENGAGKSNLLAVFNMLKAIKEYELQAYVNREGGMNAILYNGRKQTEECYIDIYREKYRFYGRIRPDNADTCFFAQQGIYDYREKHNIYAADGFRELKDGGEARKLRVFDDIGVYHFHDTSVTSLMKTNCDVNDNIELAEDGRNIAAVLLRIKQNNVETYDYIVQTIRLAAPYFKDFVLRSNPYNNDMIRLEWLKRECEKPFGAEHLSDGTLRFICIVTLLCLPEEMRKDVVCIDEPELGLHPAAIVIVSELMKKYAQERQIIVATQSVDIVDAFCPEDIVVVDNIDGQSQFKRQKTEELKEWLEDYTMSELWKKNIIGGRP